MKIVCGKYDNKIDLSACYEIDPKRKVRLGSRNPNLLKSVNYCLVGTNGEVVVRSGIHKEVRDFLSEAKLKNTRYMVLTNRERDLLLENLLLYDMDVAVFERKYPFFPDIKYSSIASSNLRNLESLMGHVNGLGIRGKSLAHYLSTKNQYKIERRIRFKNYLDKYFAFGYQGGYQEVFKAQEERNNRVIVAFDFNSMFSSCMSGDFVKPSNVKYQIFNCLFDKELKLELGMYKVILKKPKNKFIKEHHPFKFVKHGKKHIFRIEDDHEIEVLLFKNEVEYYASHFSEIFILEGLCSKLTIEHPLFSEAVKTYSKRLKATYSSNDWLASFYKLRLVMLHGSSNPKKYEVKYFDSAPEMKQHFSKTFMLNLNDVILNEETLGIIKDPNYITVKKTHNGFRVVQRQHDNVQIVNSLSAQVLANSRIKIMETIEEFLQHPSLELCYINVDSVHVSVEKRHLKGFLKSTNSLVSSDLGGLRIQCTAEKGYWFDVGRYWLFSNEKVIQYKNIVFNHIGGKKIFSRHRVINSIRTDGIFRYIKTQFRTIENSFSYSKRISCDDGIDFTNYSRYRFNEIESLNVAGDTYKQETMDSKAFKADLFNKIATD